MKALSAFFMILDSGSVKLIWALGAGLAAFLGLDPGRFTSPEGPGSAFFSASVLVRASRSFRIFSMNSRRFSGVARRGGSRHPLSLP
jgi:hypothetical protein